MTTENTEETWVQCFADKDEKWLLLLGSDWGASHGVPSSTVRTQWSPSIGDIVRFELLRAQPKETFDSIAAQIEKRPPLGFIADTLEAQGAWLKEHLRLQELRPQKTAFGLADLVKAGVFTNAISSAPDRLLETALERLQVPYQELQLDVLESNEQTSNFSILREWDDLIFQDTEDRRAREARFLKMRMAQLLEETDHVLVLGHHPYPCELMEGLLTQLPQSKPRRVVWITEDAVFSQQATGAREPNSPFHWLHEHWQGFQHVQVETLEAALDAIIEQREITPSPQATWQPPPNEEKSGITQLLNKTFDIRPTLMYVPGLALFSGLFDRIPQISIRAALSILALIAVVFGVVNYQTYQTFVDKAQPLEKQLRANQDKLNKKKDTRYQVLLQIDNDMARLLKSLKRFKYPSFSPMTLPFVPHYMKQRMAALHRQAHDLIKLRLLPQLYRHRVVLKLQDNPQTRSMSHYKTLLVSQEKLGVIRAHTASGKARLPRKLSFYNRRPRIVLYYKSAPFLQSALHKEMLRETKAGRLAVAIELNATSRHSILTRLQRKLLHVVQARKAYHKIFMADQKAIVALLRQRRISLYFLRLDTGGHISHAISRIQAFVSSYPHCRTVIGVSRKATRKAVLAATKTFVHLSISDYSFNDTYQYLRSKTSYRYVQKVYDNTYLRWNWKDPLIRSLLIDTYQQVGVAPRSIGVIYERLLQTMLSRGNFNFALKFKLLGRLAYKMARSGRPLHKEQAINAIAHLFGTPESGIEKAAALLKEMVANGVILFHPKDGVTFSDKRFQYVCLSKYLVQRPLPDKQHLLLRMPQEMMAFYAGMSPSITTLVQRWLGDYMTIDALYRAKGVHMKFANPYLYRLNYVALAIMNGRVAHRYVKQLEGILIEQISHQLLPVQAEIAKVVTQLPTPRIQGWVRDSVERDAPHDHRMLSVIAGVSNPIFATTVKRWLARVATPKDKMYQRRWTRKTSRLPQGKRRLHLYHKWAIGHALIILAQLRTPDAVQLVESYARNIHDKRFHPDDWNYFRYYAASALLRNNHFSALHRLYPDIEKNPKIWCFTADRQYYSLFQSLGKINDKPTASLLVRLLMKREPLTGSVGRYKNDAATALARIDDELVYPLLDPILTRPAPTKGPDFRVYAALVYGYKRKMDAFSKIKPIALAQRNWTPLSKDKAGVQYHSVMMVKTLAAFRTKEALAVIKKLYFTPKWRKHSPASLLDGLNFFRKPETERFMLRQIHCSQLPIKDKARILRVFGMMKSSTLHHHLNRTLQMLEEGTQPLYVKQICGKTKAATWRPKERIALTVSAIQTLAMFRQHTDIARLASWTKHPNRSIQRAAYKALGAYRTRQASDALTRSYNANPRLTWPYIQALHQQKLPYNANKLMAIFRRTKHPVVRNYLLYYLRAVGNEAALLSVFPHQYSRQVGLASNARWAFHYIAMLRRGHIRKLGELKRMIERLPSPKRKPNSRPTSKR